MTTISCPCTTCNGVTVATTTDDLITGTPKQKRDLTHNYVQIALGTSPVSGILAARHGLRVVA